MLRLRMRYEPFRRIDVCGRGSFVLISLSFGIFPRRSEGHSLSASIRLSRRHAGSRHNR
jgi:hypothetical protein